MVMIFMIFKMSATPFFLNVFLYMILQKKFVAYATNGIKNSINALVAKNINRSSAEGSEALTLCSNLEYVISSQDKNIEEILCTKSHYDDLFAAINKLNHKERELINFVYLKCNTLTSYSKLKSIPYYAVIEMKNSALKKLLVYMKNS